MFDIGPYLQCADMVAPETIRANIQVESSGRPFALNVQGIGSLYPHSASEAAALVRRYLREGRRVDAGLMQINSRNFAVLGLTPDNVFEPCTNIRAGGVILSGAYRRAALAVGDGQLALQMALSAYNTGSMRRGFLNGYVGHYYRLRQTPPTLTPTIPNQAEDSNDGRGEPFTAHNQSLLRQAALSGTRIPLKEDFMADKKARDPDAEQASLVRNFYQDLAIPGQAVEVPAPVAEALGAVEDGTVTEAEAEAAALDDIAE